MTWGLLWVHGVGFTELFLDSSLLLEELSAGSQLALSSLPPFRQRELAPSPMACHYSAAIGDGDNGPAPSLYSEKVILAQDVSWNLFRPLSQPLAFSGSQFPHGFLRCEQLASAHGSPSLRACAKARVVAVTLHNSSQPRKGQDTHEACPGH